MKNNKAGLLALIVLGIASLLMIFFVLPRISNDGKPIGDAINEAGNAVKNSVEMGGDKAGDILSDAAEETANIADKVGRLAASATQSIKDMASLFADNKVPSDADFAAARKKVEASLKELTNIDIPESLDETTSRLITTARAAAERTTAFLRGLPDSAAAAAAQVRRLAGVFAGTDDGAPEAAKPATAPADAAQVSSPTAPTFDVLRVEPDGSAVIAGKAQPGAKLEILSNGKVIAQTNIDGSGDFAAVFDNPLPPGDHELVLRSTDTNGKATQSEEVATVSVPDGKKGELLAMVSKPGKASRVLAMPEAVPPALQPQHAVPSQQPATSETTANNAPATSSGTVAPSAAASAAGAPLTSSVQVTAVEFEGSKIFVAGSAPAGSTVRGLVDDKEVGKSTTEASGHFVIEGDVDLAVGSHIVTVEELNADGTAKVRVRVPFERPQTDQATVAMQAPSASSSATTTTAPAENQSTASDRAAFEKLRTDVAKAFGILSNLYKDQATPALDQAIAGRSAVVIALKSLSEFRTAAATEPAFTAFAGEITAKARQLLATVEAWPNDVAAIGKGIASLASRLAELHIVAPPAPAPQAPAGPQTFEQAPLAESQNSVIIRRGDTLWQISRRVYGQGVRYTTIYLANEDQIKNPDLIEPGQIFGVPKEALPNAEELHRKRLKSGS
ncbi:LysM peptidoglycan-binding domain-containing protein [Rhizobium sp. BR 250]